MPKGSNQKYKLFYLSKIMLEKTDDDHYLTMPEIIAELEKYEVSAERKSIYTDLEDLSKMGIEIDSEKIGRKTCYHVVGRPFEMAELKLLVDLIQSSKFLTVKKSDELIKKLEDFCSIYEKRGLQRQVFVQNRIKTMNETVYYLVDSINTAISENKKITFHYCKWNVKKELVPRHNGMLYEVSPIALSWDDENYYLVAYDDKEDKIKHYRVDKMKKLTVSDSERCGKNVIRNFDTADYAKKNFSMFGGDEERVTLTIDNEMAGVIIDRFGKDVSFVPCGEGKSTVSLKVALSLHFITWVWALGDKVKITGPEDVYKKVKEEIKRLNEQYK